MKIYDDIIVYHSLKGDEDKVASLIDKGFDVNVKDDNGTTALICASEKGHTEIIQLLLDNGANIEDKELSFGMTALITAAFYGQTEAAKLLLEHGAKVNVKDNDNNTALDVAIIRKHQDVVKLLTRTEADKYFDLV